MEHSGDDLLLDRLRIGRVDVLVRALGRSVTLVMQKESGAYPALMQWYETRMAELMQSANAPLMKVFKERRVLTIHKGVVPPLGDTAMVTGSTVPDVAACCRSNRVLMALRGNYWISAFG